VTVVQTCALPISLACLEAIAQRRGVALSDAELRAGFAATRWPGRLQELDGAPSILLDGAHNPAGVEVLTRALDELYAGRPLHLVFGVFADKDSGPMMRALFPRVASLHLAPLHSPRSKDPSTYEALARTLAPKVACAPSVEVALEQALADAGPRDVVLVAGSLHLVGEALAVLERSFASLIAALDAFTPGDDPEETMKALGGALLAGRPSLDPPRFREAFFALLERFPDAEFGTPGALVHEVERRAGYEAGLEASLTRQPTFLTVSMVNRLMNLTDDAATLLRWSTVLEAVTRHPRAPDWVQTAARRYLEHQRAR
jgi:hypothetical protein